jgi:hypothetical protein
MACLITDHSSQIRDSVRVHQRVRSERFYPCSDASFLTSLCAHAGNIIWENGVFYPGDEGLVSASHAGPNQSEVLIETRSGSYYFDMYNGTPAE